MSETPEQETVEVSAVEELINQITDGELNKAQGSFHNIIQDKMTDALESQRIATAHAIFNTPEGLDDEDIDDITDEEIEDAIEQVFDEDEEILAELDDDDEESDSEE